MSRGGHAALAACLLLAAGAASPCTLVLSDHRGGSELARLALDAARPSIRITFIHSVLGTPVEDRYVFRRAGDDWRAHLVEERWQGEGYGLPIAAGPGERLERDGDGWRLTLDRQVHPLVVRPLPSQRMSVVAGIGPPLLLGALGDTAIAFELSQCPADNSNTP